MRKVAHHFLVFWITMALCFAGVVQQVFVFLAVAPAHVKENPYTLMKIACSYAITPVTMFALGIYWAYLSLLHADEQALARPAPRNYGSLTTPAA